MPPTWSILAPADTPLLAGRLGAVYFKAIKAWLDFFNANTVPMKNLLQRTIEAPLDTLLDVKDRAGRVIGQLNVKDNKPWSDFFNSRDDDGGGTGALEMISESPLTNGVVNVEYFNFIYVAGGTEPYTWAITSGALPSGLSFNTSTGEITGTPTEIESSTFTVEVTDDDGTVVSREFTLDTFSCRRVEFDDDFDRADVTTGLGPNWVLQTAGNVAQANMQIATNQLLISGSISSQMHARALYPDGLYWNDVGETSFSQFVKGTFISAVGTARSGLALFLNGTPTQLATFVLGAAQGYMLQIAFDAGSVFIINLADNTPIEVGLGSIATPSFNDVFEFQGDLTPTEVTMRIWQNGVLVGTRVDTTATRATVAGWPGFASGNQTASQRWDDFESRRER